MSDEHTEHLPDCCSFEFDEERHRRIMESAKRKEQFDQQMLEQSEIKDNQPLEAPLTDTVEIESVPDSLIEMYLNRERCPSEEGAKKAAAAHVANTATELYQPYFRVHLHDNHYLFARVEMFKNMNTLLDMSDDLLVQHPGDYADWAR